jgi:hypothetical protein
MNELYAFMFNRKGNTILDASRSLARRQGSNRDVDWIVSHGMCLENLIPRVSGIKQAGQGGFAQWPLRKGEIVVPVPLLQILDREVLSMYSNEDGEKTGTQLLLNYCFGHRESTLLLCPDTNAILINHCSDRQNECGSQGPNAKFQWASGWEAENDRWLNMSIDEMSQEQDRGLAMEIVATRDILDAEEVSPFPWQCRPTKVVCANHLSQVFIDYGEGWENAWKHHVEMWRKNQIDCEDECMSIKELNEGKGAIPILVSGDLRKLVSHQNLFTGCAYTPSEEDYDEVYYEEFQEWVNMSDAEILGLYASSGRHATASYMTHIEYTYWPCSVALQEGGNGTRYTVRILQSPHFDQMPWDEHSVPRFLTNFPRAAIHFFRRPYASDQHMKGSFRHYIEIPDAMLPEKWRNSKAEN